MADIPDTDNWEVPAIAAALSLCTSLSAANLDSSIRTFLVAYKAVAAAVTAGHVLDVESILKSLETKEAK